MVPGLLSQPHGGVNIVVRADYGASIRVKDFSAIVVMMSEDSRDESSIAPPWGKGQINHLEEPPGRNASKTEPAVGEQG